MNSVCVRNREMAHAAESLVKGSEWYEMRWEGQQISGHTWPLGLSTECEFQERGELLEGFKQGSGVNCFLMFNSHSACCAENEVEGANMDLGNQQGGRGYNPDRRRRGLGPGWWHWKWWEVVGCGKPVVDGLDRGPGWRWGEKKERGHMYLLVLSLVLDISTFHRCCCCCFQCPEIRQKACFLGFLDVRGKRWLLG